MKISELHKIKTGKVSDKWESYLEYYDRILLPFKDKAVSILEIGIQNGGSLETWAQYFKYADLIIGCDIDEKCESLRYDDPRIVMVIGDIKSQETMARIKKQSPAFDIIIDDGSHTAFDIFMTFCMYFNALKPGGVFIIEDTHTLYLKAYGGGDIFDSQSTQKFFHALTEAVNYEFWSDYTKLNTLFAPWFQDTKLPEFIEHGWVDVVEFRNSIITVHKSMNPSHNKLGRRVVTGEIAQVNSAPMIVSKLINI